MRSLVVVRSLDSAVAVRVDVVGRNFCLRMAYAAAGSDGTPSMSPHLGFWSTYLGTKRTSFQNEMRLKKNKSQNQTLIEGEEGRRASARRVRGILGYGIKRRTSRWGGWSGRRCRPPQIPSGCRWRRRRSGARAAAPPPTMPFGVLPSGGRGG